MAGQALVIFVASDSTGDTGETVVKVAATQFYPRTFDVRRVPFVVEREAIDHLIKEAQRENAIIVFTIVIPELKEYLLEQARIHNVKAIDILGPLLHAIEDELGQKARCEPGAVHPLDEEYSKKVEAVEFALKYDDGRDFSGILHADIVLVGVSRTSKTPLSMYLAHKKFKVANVPLVPEIQPPDLLFTVNKNKIIGLTIKPDILKNIRGERLKMLGLPKNASYANMERITYELEFADKIMSRIGCVVIDVSNKAVEEAASLILDHIAVK
jgi:hypothetical protein